MTIHHSYRVVNVIDAKLDYHSHWMCREHRWFYPRPIKPMKVQHDFKVVPFLYGMSTDGPLVREWLWYCNKHERYCPEKLG